jgi:opacity protein-like surface antigen
MSRHLLALAALIVIASPAPAAAQYIDAYAFTGVSGPHAPLWQGGGGIERVFSNGVGVSAEGGVATNGDRYQKLTHLSVNGLLHFMTKDQHLDPFLLGGVGMVADWDAVAGTFTIGGGLNYWTSLRIGVRLEVKDNIASTPSNGLFHMPGFRIGIVLR